MEMRKVKEEPEDVDDTSADVFEAKEVELKEECLLVKPEILAEVSKYDSFLMLYKVQFMISGRGLKVKRRRRLC